MKNSSVRRVAAIVCSGLLVACGDLTGPGGSLHRMGILQMENATTLTVQVTPDESIRWSVAPSEGAIYPPSVIEAPDTIAINQTFEVTAYTVGPDGCWTAGGMDVAQAGRVIELTPWDQKSDADLCTQVFGYLAHTTSLKLDQLGEWTLRVRGRRVRGSELADDSVTADRTIVVVAGYSSEQRREIVLAPGDEILVDGIFGVLFSEVTEDSRCPTDVVCVWQGNAAVVIGLTMGEGPTFPFTLNTGSGPNAATHAGHRVQLLDLTPYPRSDSAIAQRDYRAKLLIELVDPPGTWGSDQASLTIDGNGATLLILASGGCYGSFGTFDAPPASGAFSIPGTYTQLTGVAPGRVESAAQFSGTGGGQEISLTVTVPAVPAALGPFTLTRGVTEAWSACLYP
ncbi:MAG: hypothetical protein OEO79_12215 [Gemmatimonadota bacterium]|nr:hypothetical protein [Gemmatimonadota bacterium]MDH3422781.1 hypothetical protein [Gemmatimonadota bacterium]